MKPKPLAGLNHLTTPFAILSSKPHSAGQLPTRVLPSCSHDANPRNALRGLMAESQAEPGPSDKFSRDTGRWRLIPRRTWRESHTQVVCKLSHLSFGCGDRI